MENKKLGSFSIDSLISKTPEDSDCVKDLDDTGDIQDEDSGPSPDPMSSDGHIPGPPSPHGFMPFYMSPLATAIHQPIFRQPLLLSPFYAGLPSSSTAVPPFISAHMNPLVRPMTHSPPGSGHHSVSLSSQDYYPNPTPQTHKTDSYPRFGPRDDFTGSGLSRRYLKSDSRSESPGSNEDSHEESEGQL